MVRDFMRCAQVSRLGRSGAVSCSHPSTSVISSSLSRSRMPTISPSPLGTEIRMASPITSRSTYWRFSPRTVRSRWASTRTGPCTGWARMSPMVATRASVGADREVLVFAVDFLVFAADFVVLAATDKGGLLLVGRMPHRYRGPVDTGRSRRPLPASGATGHGRCGGGVGVARVLLNLRRQGGDTYGGLPHDRMDMTQSPVCDVSVLSARRSRGDPCGDPGVIRAVAAG